MKYFTADCHFGHEAILDFPHRREFKDINEWDKMLLDNINHAVGKHDTLFILGDLTCGGDPAKYRNKLKCKNIWIMRGNHDASMTRLKIIFGKENVRDVMETKVCGTPTWLSHYAHAFWPKSHRGSYHLYGHTHFSREGTLNVAFPGRRSIDVGVDSAKNILGEFIPFSEEFLDSILGPTAKLGHDNLDYYARYDAEFKNA